MRSIIFFIGLGLGFQVEAQQIGPPVGTTGGAIQDNISRSFGGPTGPTTSGQRPQQSSMRSLASPSIAAPSGTPVGAATPFHW